MLVIWPNHHLFFVDFCVTNICSGGQTLPIFLASFSKEFKHLLDRKSVFTLKTEANWCYYSALKSTIWLFLKLLFFRKVIQEALLKVLVLVILMTIQMRSIYEAKWIWKIGNFCNDAWIYSELIEKYRPLFTPTNSLQSMQKNHYCQKFDRSYWLIFMTLPKIHKAKDISLHL